MNGGETRQTCQSHHTPRRQNIECFGVACGSRLDGLTFPTRARKTDALLRPPTAVLFFFFSVEVCAALHL